MSDDPRLREELVQLIEARNQEHEWQEEALLRHERVNDILVTVLRDVLDRLDAVEARLGIDRSECET